MKIRSMIRSILVSILVILVIFITFSLIEHYSYRKSVRSLRDMNCIRQMVAVIKFYKNEYKVWPSKIEDILISDDLDSSYLRSKQGIYLGVPYPHYDYYRPILDNPVDNFVLIRLKPECMERKNGKTLVGYFDGRVVSENIDQR